MKNFEFVSPTKIYFGKDQSKNIGQILVSEKAKNVLVVIGKNSVKKSGLLDLVTESLKQAKINYFLLEGVRANPSFDLVKEGVELVKKENIDYLLAIGGGSVIDTAKCIAVNYDNDGVIKDYNFHKKNPDHALPLGVILTISAAGSELSNSCVIQHDATGMKMGFNSDVVRPRFAIEDPSYTISVSKEQTAYGIVDILMHSLERYFSYSEEYELADEFALGLIKNVIDIGLLAYKHLDNYEYRARLMLASSFSHNGITSIGKPYSMPVHQLEHPLSGMYTNIAHGCGLAVLFPAWAKYYYQYDPEKFAKLGERVFNIKSSNVLKAANLTIQEIEKYFKALDMPSSLKELGVKKEDIEILTDKVTRKGTRVIRHHIKDMDEDVVRYIYHSCY